MTSSSISARRSHPLPGKASFEGGGRTAALGLALHYLIALMNYVGVPLRGRGLGRTPRCSMVPA
jgi:hypothetical protein